MFLCLLLALAQARRGRRRGATNEEQATNQRLTREIAALFNRSLAAQTQAATEATEAIKATTDTFKRFLKSVPLHTVHSDHSYKRLIKKLSRSLFQIEFYLKTLSEDPPPLADVKYEVGKRAQELRKRLESVKLAMGIENAGHRKSRK